MVDCLREHVLEAANGLVAVDESVAQVLLLTFELLGQRGIRRFELAQPMQVGAIGGADEMREHVHVAERLPYHLVGRQRMREQRPIGPGNIAAAHRVFPQRANRGGVLGLRKAVERDAMAPVERLLQQFCALLGTGRHQHAERVHVVVAGHIRARNLQPDKEPAKLAGRHACADDRAMQGGVHVPDAASPFRAMLRGDDRSRVRARRVLCRHIHQLGDGMRFPHLGRDVVNAGQHVLRTGRHSGLRYIPLDIATMARCPGREKCRVNARAVHVATGMVSFAI